MKSNKSFPNVPWMELGYGDDFAPENKMQRNS